MIFHVEMTVNIPYTLDTKVVDGLKAKEKEFSQKLQKEGKWVYLWRVAGKYSNISIFDVADAAELHEILSNLPLFPFMQIEVKALCKHYSSIREKEL